MVSVWLLMKIQVAAETVEEAECCCAELLLGKSKYAEASECATVQFSLSADVKISCSFLFC
jgi:hypothetical protein